MALLKQFASEVSFLKTMITNMRSLLAVLLGSVAVCVSNAGAADLQKPAEGKRIRVFIFAGQSNMEGRADGTKLSAKDEARLLQAQKRIQLAYNRQPLRPLDSVSPPDDIREIYKVDRIFGPELFFGLSMAEAWPDEKMLFIKRAVGSTSMYGCWNPNWSAEKAAVLKEENEPRLYSDMIAYVKELLSGYAPDQYEICGMFWVQGESDGKSHTAAAAYGENLRALIEGVRKEVGNRELPFALLQVGNLKVVEGMKQTAQDVPNVSLLTQSADPASPEFLPTIPNGHYNHEGMKRIGDRFAKTFLNQYKNKTK